MVFLWQKMIYVMKNLMALSAQVSIKWFFITKNDFEVWTRADGVSSHVSQYEIKIMWFLHKRKWFSVKKICWRIWWRVISHVSLLGNKLMWPLHHRKRFWVKKIIMKNWMELSPMSHCINKMWFFITEYDFEFWRFWWSYLPMSHNMKYNNVVLA